MGLRAFESTWGVGGFMTKVNDEEIGIEENPPVNTLSGATIPSVQADQGLVVLPDLVGEPESYGRTKIRKTQAMGRTEETNERTNSKDYCERPEPAGFYRHTPRQS